MKQHKWHKEIKAWADGAEIEIRQFDGNRNDWTLWCKADLFTLSQAEKLSDGKWQIRIKPQQQQPQYLYVYETGFNVIAIQLSLKDNLESYKCIGKIKLEVEE